MGPHAYGVKCDVMEWVKRITWFNHIEREKSCKMKIQDEAVDA